MARFDPLSIQVLRPVEITPDPDLELYSYPINACVNTSEFRNLPGSKTLWQ